MIFFAVTNGNYIEGYYQKHENAVKAVKETDKLIKEFKNNPNVDKKGCWIEILETHD